MNILIIQRVFQCNDKQKYINIQREKSSNSILQKGAVEYIHIWAT